MELVFTTIWIFLPAAFANMFAMISRHFPKISFIEKPIDMGKSWNGQRILGDGKTYRGYVFGILFSILFTIGQYYLTENLNFIKDNLEIDFLDFNPIIWGGLVGFGALLGDSIESFFKRRVGIQRGKSWFPFDQTDFVIGASLISLIYRQFELKYYIAFLAIFFVGHICIKFIGYKLKIDDKPI